MSVRRMNDSTTYFGIFFNLLVRKSHITMDVVCLDSYFVHATMKNGVQFRRKKRIRDKTVQPIVLNR